MYNFLENLFLSILNMSITASYCILAVIVIRLFLKKVPKKYSYILWGIPMFRLVCPASFSTVLSIFNMSFFDMSSVQKNNTMTYIPADITYTNTPDISLGISGTNEAIDSLVSNAASQKNLIEIITGIAVLVWCVGIAAMLIYSVISYLILRRRVSKAVKYQNNIFECENINSPFVMGLFRPKIYIPFHLNETEREYIITHEKHHIKRLDFIIKPIAFAVLALHWFNPLVWLAFALMSQDMEMSCDEYVLDHTDSNIKKEYGTSLLSFASNRSFPAAVPLAFGESAVKTRIKNVLKYKKTGILISVISIVAVIIIAVVCISNPTDGSVLHQIIPEKLDKAVIELIFKDNEGNYHSNSDCKTEGHEIFCYEETDNIVKVYGYVHYTELNFMNGYLCYFNGGGMSAPFVAEFEVLNGEYVNGVMNYPRDGSLYTESIKEMFPGIYAMKAISYNNHDYISKQQETYAEKYLESVGFDCKIALHPDDFETKLLPAADSLPDGYSGADVNYPFWLGTQMFNENGKWIVYAQFYNEKEQKAYLTSYENGSTQAVAHVYSLNGRDATYIGDETITVYPFFEDKNLDSINALPDTPETTSSVIIV